MAVKNEISEAKIRNCVWMLRNKKTKKACCAYLGIGYNTKKLATILEDFQNKESRIKELRAKVSKAPISDSTRKDIINSYLQKEAMSKIGERHFISAPRVKKVLLEAKIPIRGRGKKTPAKIDHINEDYDKRLEIGERIYIPGRHPDEFINPNRAKIQLVNVYGIVRKRFDEEYLEELSNGYRKAVYNKHIKVTEEYGEIEGIHFSVYWYLENGTQWGMANAFQHHYTTIENSIMETGRESYEIWIDDPKVAAFYTVKREELMRVINEI